MEETHGVVRLCVLELRFVTVPQTDVHNGVFRTVARRISGRRNDCQ